MARTVFEIVEAYLQRQAAREEPDYAPYEGEGRELRGEALTVACERLDKWMKEQYPGGILQAIDRQREDDNIAEEFIEMLLLMQNSEIELGNEKGWNKELRSMIGDLMEERRSEG